MLFTSTSTVIKAHFLAPKGSLERRHYERFEFKHYGPFWQTVKVMYGTIK